MAATVDGDLEYGVQFVGQSIGQVETILSVEQVIQNTIREAAEVICAFSLVSSSDDMPLMPHDEDLYVYVYREKGPRACTLDVLFIHSPV